MLYREPLSVKHGSGLQKERCSAFQVRLQVSVEFGADFLDRQRPDSGASATAAASCGSCLRCAVFGSRLEYSPGDQNVERTDGRDARKCLNPAEHIERFAFLALVPEVERRREYIGQAGIRTSTGKAAFHFRDHG